MENGKFLSPGRKMKFLNYYKEFGAGDDAPSMKDFFLDKKYPGQDIIVEYLKNGTPSMVGVGYPIDVYTNERIPGENILMSDGEYDWFRPLAYYVQKYNLQLPIEFQKHVLSKRI